MVNPIARYALLLLALASVGIKAETPTQAVDRLTDDEESDRTGNPRMDDGIIRLSKRIAHEQDTAVIYGNALNNEVNASPDDLPQAAQTAQAATTPMLQDAANTALTVPGTSFTGPVDVPEFNGEKPTSQDIQGAITDAGKDQVRDATKDAYVDSLNNENSKKSACSQ